MTTKSPDNAARAEGVTIEERLADARRQSLDASRVAYEAKEALARLELEAATARARAKLETALADAVRALPVIATCGECGWCVEELHVGSWCDRDAKQRDVSAGDAPPSWCPLRGKR